MGVPSFYRWLVNRYPKIVLDATAQHQSHVTKEETNSAISSVSSTSSMEFDNLYLDMNGIIHPCFHPEDNFFPPTTYEDVFNSIYEYIDNLFNIVRPRKLLYLAIDGVAPRAKMNQQRTRRFRTAKDSDLADETEDMLRKKFEAEGKTVLPKQESELCDSNVITPGTEFMHLLAIKLQDYITLRVKTDPRWEHIKVILSDSNVPGEGEHKIMSFIRTQRCGKDYDPNTRHCLYGLDADLIMLALATHEAHFFILREDVLAEEKQGAVSDVERQVEAYLQKSKQFSKQINNLDDSSDQTQKREPVKKKPFQFLDVCLLREYLQIDMDIDDPPEGVAINLERLIDDFIFMCFFSGNDFLPHMPTLEIHERAIDLLLHVYKREFKKMGGYLVDTQKIEDKKGAYIKLKRVERFVVSVGEYEDDIFKKRSEIRERKMKRILDDCHAEVVEEEDKLAAALDCSTFATNEGNITDNINLINLSTQNLQLDDFVEMTADSSEYTAQVLRNTLELKQKLKEHLRNQSDTFKDGVFGSDKVKLGVPGWRERYYEDKFSTNGKEELEINKKLVVQKYVEGLVWVLKYYFSGVPSWNWYYPFYYAPFASDLKGISQVSVTFQKGSPFKPFDQLMGVLPPKSSHALPIAFKGLMVDGSKIINFYPTVFPVDADGKRFLWQAVSKLPFIEEELLLAETRVLDKDLTDHEKLRNAEGKDRLFLRRPSNASLTAIRDGLNGYNIQFESDQLTALDSGCTDKDSDVLSLFFELPLDCSHKPYMLENVDVREKTLTPEDIVTEELWHSCRGMNRQGRFTANQGYNRNKPNSRHVSQPHHFINPEEVGWCGGNGRGWGRGRGRGRSFEVQQNIVPGQSPVPSFPTNHYRVPASTTTWTSSRGPSPSGFGNNNWQNGPTANDFRGRWGNESYPRANDADSRIHHTSYGLGYNPRQNGPRANNAHGRWPNESFPGANNAHGMMHTSAGMGYNPRQYGPRSNDTHVRIQHTQYEMGYNPRQYGPRSNETHVRIQHTHSEVGYNLRQYGPRSNDTHVRIQHSQSGLGYNPKQNGPRVNEFSGRWPNESFPRGNDTHDVIPTPSGPGYNPWQSGPRANDMRGRIHTPSGSDHKSTANYPRGLGQNESFPKADDTDGWIQWGRGKGRAKGRYFEREV